MITREEERVIEILLNLAYKAWCLADNTCDDGDNEVLSILRTDFDELCKQLDALDELPDDQPGYVMAEAAKARWALRRLIGS